MNLDKLRDIHNDLQDSIYTVAEKYSITQFELAGLLLGQINYLFEDKTEVIRLYNSAAEITRLSIEKSNGTVH